MPELYIGFARYVRARLAALGVRDADVWDVCHEVFLIVYQHRELAQDIRQPSVWLNAICTRAAAGYRRRARYTREVLGLDADEHLAIDDDSELPAERHVEAALLQLALERLDHASCDLLLLYHVGDMPLSELAKLVAQDRKTVRKRLAAAQKRVLALLCADGLRARRS